MADIINLNQFRKTKAKADKKAQADQNAITFGRKKADKQLDRARKDQDDSRLEGHKQDD
ncbi:DUF4169 family protein [Phaeobacter sp.]|uniref:DUF4169 family protein n=1 Tax=Phaeobacter sp. TaxID=1902409 RepID=UPI0025CE6BEA|nr:DUF4169 family protein [Phaeobacter sp.]